MSLTLSVDELTINAMPLSCEARALLAGIQWNT